MFKFLFHLKSHQTSIIRSTIFPAHIIYTIRIIKRSSNRHCCLAWAIIRDSIHIEAALTFVRHS
jgi:hypothetical protein